MVMGPAILVLHRGSSHLHVVVAKGVVAWEVGAKCKPPVERSLAAHIVWMTPS